MKYILTLAVVILLTISTSATACPGKVKCDKHLHQHKEGEGHGDEVAPKKKCNKHKDAIENSVDEFPVIGSETTGKAVFKPASENQVPFASDIESNIKHYNRATQTLATSGNLGDGAVQELANKGFSTIIDLRTEGEGVAEEKAKVEDAGMKYINIPVTGAGISADQLAEFTTEFDAIADGDLTLIHCGSGNRVGAMLTKYYISKGVPNYIALEKGRVAGMKPTLESKILPIVQN